MNERQKRFCELYAADPNATKAARGAGYSERTARFTGRRLLTNVGVQNYIRELQESMRQERIADAEEIKATLTSFLRDEKVGVNSRITAANTLLKSGGAMFGKAEADSAEQEAEADDFVRVILPYSCRDTQLPNAVQLPSGEVVPLAGAEDSDMWIYAPFHLWSEEDFMITDADRRIRDEAE